MEPKRANRTRRKGIAMATVLWILVILFVIGASISILAINHASFVLDEKNDAAAESAARAGLSRILVTAGEVQDWTGSSPPPSLASQLVTNGMGPTQKNYPDLANQHVYFMVAAPLQVTSNTALVQSTGFVTSGTAILKLKEIQAYIHQQFPLSAGSALYSSTCITSSGNPNVNCGVAAPIVAMTCNPTSIIVNPPCTLVAQPSNAGQWPFPDVNISQVTADAQANTVNNYGGSGNFTPNPAPYSHDFNVSGATPNLNSLINGNTFNYHGVPVSGIVGSNYFEAAPGSGIEINASGGFTSANTDCLLPYDYGPNFVIVRNADLRIGGNGNYYGVVIVINGSVKVQGSPTVHGAIFATGGVLSGGANFTVDYDKNCVKAMRGFWKPVVQVDSLWIGSQTPSP